jgi:hypothetical protein
MGLNRYILNRDIDLKDKVKRIFDKTYPDVAHPDRMDINRSLSTQGIVIDPYESEGSDPKIKIVWGTTRMGSKKTVTL